MTCSRTHTEPHPKIHWTQWACVTCTPELYEAMTVQGPEPNGRFQCPMCLNLVSYKDGRFRRHFNDGPLDNCRASELCLDMAQALFNAICRRLTVQQMLDDFVVRPGERKKVPIKRGALSIRLCSMVDELVWARQMHAVLATEIASELGVTKGAFSKWESKEASCFIDDLCRWARYLGYRVALKTDDGEVRTDLMTRLWDTMYARNVSFDEIEQATGLCQSDLNAWRQLKCVPTSHEFDMIAQCLGFQLALVRA